VLIGTFLGPLGGVIVGVSLPTIAGEFHVGLQTVKWVILIYQLVMTFLLPVVARLGRRFGESRLFVLGFCIDGAGALVSGLIPGGMFWLLIVVRALQAVGAALLFALFSALVTRLVPPERRGVGFGLAGAVVGLSILIAPPLGGVLCAFMSWRWVFFVQLPFHVLGAVQGWRLLPRDPVGRREPEPWAGIGLWLVLVSALELLAEACSHGWQPRWAALLAGAALAALAAFVFSERGRLPLFNYAVFRFRAFWMGALGTLSINLVFQVMILLLPFYFETYLRYAPERMGLFLGLSPLATLVAAPLAGALSDRLGPRWVALSGFALGAAGFALMAWRGLGQGLAATAAAGGGLAAGGGAGGGAGTVAGGSLLALGAGLALLGAAGGFFNSPVIATMMGSVGPELRPYASSVGSLTRNLGFVAGTTLGSLWLAQFMALRGWHGGAALQEAGSFSAPAGPFTYALTAVFWICAAWCALLAVAYGWYPNQRAVRGGGSGGNRSSAPAPVS
jgi:MFS family permease